MASSYPSGLDAVPTNKADSTVMVTDHAAHHNDLADAVNKIEAELGTDPSAGFTTVKARIAGVEQSVAALPGNVSMYLNTYYF